MWAGVPLSDSTFLTPGDIEEMVDIQTEKQKDFYRMLAWIIYTGASLTAVGFNNPKKFPSIEAAFPTLFEREEQQSWWTIKERIEQFAHRRNQLNKK